jgi:hypothetical protein
MPELMSLQKTDPKYIKKTEHAGLSIKNFTIGRSNKNKPSEET